MKAGALLMSLDFLDLFLRERVEVLSVVFPLLVDVVNLLGSLVSVDCSEMDVLLNRLLLSWCVMASLETVKFRFLLLCLGSLLTCPGCRLWPWPSTWKCDFYSGHWKHNGCVIIWNDIQKLSTTLLGSYSSTWPIIYYWLMLVRKHVGYVTFLLHHWI